MTSVQQSSDVHYQIWEEGSPIVFTARIRRMGEGNVLTRVCPSVCPQGVSQRGGGSGQSSRGGTGQSSWGGGVRSVQPGGGVRSVQLGGVRSVHLGGGQVSPAGGGGSAKIGQQNEYSLLHGGQYASCVHAGGLSCLGFFSHKTRRA